MNGLPYYKAYPRDFIEGTIGMSFELKGAYRLVLDLIYMQGGNLPDDPRYIAGLLGCTIRKWKSLRQRLIDGGKLSTNGEFLTNKRAVFELETLAKLQENKRENRSRPNKNKDLESRKCDDTEPEPDTEIDGDDAGATEREELLEAMGHDRTGLTANGRLVGNQADMAERNRWADLGLTHSQQLGVIRECMARKPDGPPNSFRYFTGAMQRLAGELHRPEIRPTACGTVQPFPQQFRVRAQLPEGYE